MPIYEYRCRSCDHVFEVIQPVGSDGKKLVCPECGTPSPEKKPSVYAAGSCGSSGSFG